MIICRRTLSVIMLGILFVSFRITKAASSGYYFAIDEFYSRDRKRPFNETADGHNLANLSLVDLYNDIAHDKHDMIVRYVH